MSFGSQSSGGYSGRGLLPDAWSHFSNYAPEWHRELSGVSREAAADPGGLQFMNQVNSLLPVGPYGVPEAATQGAFNLGRDMYGLSSASRAMRGFGSPANLEGVIGDAIMNSNKTLLPLATQTAFTRAQLAPALRNASMGFSSIPFTTASNMLSGTGQSVQSSQGLGIDLSSIISAAGTIGGAQAGAGTAVLGFSDRRLKTNIVRIGTHKLGIGIYSYVIFNQPTIGVMADEVLTVKPEAVVMHSSGYLMVDYGRINT